METSIFKRKLYIVICLFHLSVVAFAQGTINYTYDNAGHRVKREIVMPAQKAMTAYQASPSDERLYADVLQNHPIKICSHPAAGTLTICVHELKNTDKCMLWVYTTQGAQVQKENVSSDRIDIDISSQPEGIYLLKIDINEKSTTWKIIRK